jgi:pilus assembly protein CpaE
VEAALRRVQLTRQPLAEVAPASTVVVVTGHKGGCGTTTVAINLAVALADLNHERCALVDLGRPFPDVGNFLDHDTTYDLADVIQNLDSLDQSFFKRIMQPYGRNLDILHGISDFKEQDRLDLEGVGKIFSILRSLYKYTVVDLGHLFDELFFRVFGEADLVLMLTELNVPNFRNLRKFWPLLKEWDPGGQKVKLVVNRHNKGNGLGLQELKRILDEPPFAVLPQDYAPLMEAINQGVHLAKVGPRSKFCLGLKDAAQKVMNFGSGVAKDAGFSRPRRRFWIF